MQNKKVILLVILAFLAIASLIYGMGAGHRKDASGRGVIKKKNAAAAAEKDIAESRRRARRTDFRSWKRSPFIPKGEPRSKLTLNGILADGANFKAMIGDTIVGKGGMVDGSRVIEVTKDKVILNDGTKDFELKLER
ncbi:MAG: hypothetical protein WC522_09110 [Candidatus Omnitrophota bacterium]